MGIAPVFPGLEEYAECIGKTYETQLRSKWYIPKNECLVDRVPKAIACYLAISLVLPYKAASQEPSPTESQKTN